MRPTRIAPAALAAALALACPAFAQEALPDWTKAKARFAKDEGTRAFVAVGKSVEPGPSDYKSELAEADARQAMAQLVADWQERALACAKKASETKVTAKSNRRSGLTFDATFERETTVAFYRDRVVDRAYEGNAILVLVRHELAAMIDGIAGDETRTAGLRDAARACGETAFDELVAKQDAPAPAATTKAKAKSKPRR